MFSQASKHGKHKTALWAHKGYRDLRETGPWLLKSRIDLMHGFIYLCFFSSRITAWRLLCLSLLWLGILLPLLACYLELEEFTYR